MLFLWELFETGQAMCSMDLNSCSHSASQMV